MVLETTQMGPKAMIVQMNLEKVTEIDMVVTIMTGMVGLRLQISMMKMQVNGELTVTVMEYLMKMMYSQTTLVNHMISMEMAMAIHPQVKMVMIAPMLPVTPISIELDA